MSVDTLSESWSVASVPDSGLFVQQAGIAARRAL